MKIHEYQGKEIFRRYGVAVPKGIAVKTPDEARAAAETLIAETGIPVVVVKSQVHAGGRGKGKVYKGAEVVARGVEVIKGGADAAAEAASRMLGGRLVTIQTGAEGTVVKTAFVEQGIAIARELYLGMLVDRDARRIVVMASSEGGMDIEKVAEETPEKILKEWIDPVTGLQGYHARKLGYGLGLSKDQVAKFGALLSSLYKLFVAEDCSLVEVNPLIVTQSGDVMALDAKINFDDNADFRHKEWEALRDLGEENHQESEAKAAGLSYVALDGNIGCLVNGAGLAMATMDIVSHCGGVAGELPRRGRRRHRRGRHARVRDHPRVARGEGDLREHLRRHHEVRRDRGGRHQRHAKARTEGSPRGAPRGHQRGARSQDARRERPRDHPRVDDARRRAEDHRPRQGRELKGAQRQCRSWSIGTLASWCRASRASSGPSTRSR